jgi:hypothetical protein
VGVSHDFGGVAMEIPYGGVDLCQRDLHCFSLAMRSRGDCLDTIEVRDMRAGRRAKIRFVEVWRADADI